VRRRLDAVAARDAWRAFAASRLLVLLAVSCGAVLFQKAEAGYSASPSYTSPFEDWPLVGGLLDFFLAPFVRWDAQWYLNIAETGYEQEGQADLGARPAFFPLYPLLIRALGGFSGHGGAVLASIVISLAAFLGALYLLHRLVTFELDVATARASVWMLALSPVAFYFSAPYTESLFLLLSIGSLYAARTKRWWLAGVLAGLASATRPTGALLFIPLVLLYLSDGRLRPSSFRRPRPSILWLALVPSGLIAYSVYLSNALGAWDQWKAAQYLHGRPETLPPWTGLRRGAAAVWNSFQGDVAEHLQFPVVLEAGFLAFAVVAIVGVFRLLPPAYGLYCIAVLVPPILTPVVKEPLASIPRFTLSCFPLYVWLAHVAMKRGVSNGVLTACAAALAVLSAAFAAWAHLV
jgi:hypothetical protein